MSHIPKPESVIQWLNSLKMAYGTWRAVANSLDGNLDPALLARVAKGKRAPRPVIRALQDYRRARRTQSPQAPEWVRKTADWLSEREWATWQKSR